MLECKTILDSAAARNNGGGGGDNCNSNSGFENLEKFTSFQGPVQTPKYMKITSASLSPKLPGENRFAVL